MTTWTDLFIHDARRYLDALDPDEHKIAQPAIDAFLWLVIAREQTIHYADAYSELVSASVNNAIQHAYRSDRARRQ